MKRRATTQVDLGLPDDDALALRRCKARRQLASRALDNMCQTKEFHKAAQGSGFVPYAIHGGTDVYSTGYVPKLKQFPVYRPNGSIMSGGAIPRAVVDAMEGEYLSELTKRREELEANGVPMSDADQQPRPFELPTGMDGVGEQVVDGTNAKPYPDEDDTDTVERASELIRLLSSANTLDDISRLFQLAFNPSILNSPLSTFKKAHKIALTYIGDLRRPEQAPAKAQLEAFAYFMTMIQHLKETVRDPAAQRKAFDKLASKMKAELAKIKADDTDPSAAVSRAASSVADGMDTSSSVVNGVDEAAFPEPTKEETQVINRLIEEADPLLEQLFRHFPEYKVEMQSNVDRIRNGIKAGTTTYAVFINYVTEWMQFAREHLSSPQTEVLGPEPPRTEASRRNRTQLDVDLGSASLQETNFSGATRVPESPASDTTVISPSTVQRQLDLSLDNSNNATEMETLGRSPTARISPVRADAAVSSPASESTAISPSTLQRQSNIPSNGSNGSSSISTEMETLGRMPTRKIGESPFKRRTTPPSSSRLPMAPLSATQGQTANTAVSSPGSTTEEETYGNPTPRRDLRPTIDTATRSTPQGAEFARVIAVRLASKQPVSDVEVDSAFRHYAPEEDQAMITTVTGKRSYLAQVGRYNEIDEKLEKLKRDFHGVGRA